MAHPAFTIVIPAYNEETRLPTSLRDIQSFFASAGDAIEVLVIVEPSQDNTLAKSRETVDGDPRFQIIDNQIHKGKGYAVRSGMLRARGEYIFFMDADLSTPLSEVLTFLGYFQDHSQAAVLIGSREHAKSKIIKKQSWFRQNLGRTFNRFVQMIAVKGITDTQCGFKAFRKKAAQEIFSRQQINGFAFDVEVLLLAQGLGFAIEVLPVKWVNSPQSKVRILIDPFKMLWELFQVRRLVRRSLRAKPPST